MSLNHLGVPPIEVPTDVVAMSWLLIRLGAPSSDFLAETPTLSLVLIQRLYLSIDELRETGHQLDQIMHDYYGLPGEAHRHVWQQDSLSVASLRGSWIRLDLNRFEDVQFVPLHYRARFEDVRHGNWHVSSLEPLGNWL